MRIIWPTIFRISNVVIYFHVVVNHHIRLKKKLVIFFKLNSAASHVSEDHELFSLKVFLSYILNFILHV